MTHEETPEIKLRPDGSIDTAFYTAIGRQRRSEAAYKLVEGIAPDRRFLSLRRWFSMGQVTQ